MSRTAEELLNVYDVAGAVSGARRRGEALSEGLALGAVNVLLTNPAGQVLLQRRHPEKENGGLWDKSVGGHVGAGESFDATAVREAGEELFDDPTSPKVVLAPDLESYRAQATRRSLTSCVVFRRAGLVLNLRDVRRAPGGALRNVVYHVSIYLGRTDVPVDGFHPQAAEVTELCYFPATEVDALLLEGRLAPNMAYLWLTHAFALLAPHSA